MGTLFFCRCGLRLEENGLCQQCGEHSAWTRAFIEQGNKNTAPDSGENRENNEQR